MRDNHKKYSDLEVNFYPWIWNTDGTLNYLVYILKGFYEKIRNADHNILLYFVST